MFAKQLTMAAAKIDEVKKRENAEAAERSSPSGTVVYKAILKEGFDELERPSWALFWSGLAAGLSMGASLITEGLLASHLPDTEWKPLITKFGYSIGFLVVILGRQQLFTENTLTPILPLMLEKTWKRFVGVMRLWGIVLVSNLLGCVAAAFVIGSDTVFSAEVRFQFAEIGRQVVAGSFESHLLRGILAGWLIALMVWVLPFAESARFWVIILLSYIVGLGHFSHVIAGSVDTFFITITGEISWLDAFIKFILPTIMGNIIGGVALVAAINHAQVVSGKKQTGI